MIKEIKIPSLLNPESISGLSNQLSEAEKDGARFLVLKRSETIFCNGLDLKWVVKNVGLKALIDNRYKITVPQYEAMENYREQRIKEGNFTPDYNMVAGLYDATYKGKGLLIYTGSEGYYRNYKFS